MNSSGGPRDRSSGRRARPNKHLAVVTCMDGRIDPLRILALGLGDIHVIRNAGGIVTEDVLRSLLVSQRMLGTREVLIIMHTDCGLYGLDDAKERAAVEAEIEPANSVRIRCFQRYRGPGRRLGFGGADLSVPPPPRPHQRRHLRRRFGSPSSPALRAGPTLLPSAFAFKSGPERPGREV